MNQHKLNVSIINTQDSRGGAAKLAYRLKTELEERGYPTSILVEFKLGNDPKVHEIKRNPILSVVNQKLRLNSLIYPTLRYLKEDQFFRGADLIHLHNIHDQPYGYFNVLDLPKLAELKPTVWTLHDPWSIYHLGLTPEYQNIFRVEPRFYNFLKYRSIHKAKLTMVTPSRWLERKVGGVYGNKRIEVIPNGVDTNIFKPGDKVQAREKLGIHPSSKVVLFIANAGEENISKGAKYLSQLREKLQSDKVRFISMGSFARNEYIDSEGAVADYYRAADIFILPSLAENFPLTILEAMACGTPVVAFGIGGVPEQVEHLKTGYLAKYQDSTDLVRGVKLLLADRELAQKMGQTAASRVRRHLSIDRMTDRYVKLYEELVKQ